MEKTSESNFRLLSCDGVPHRPRRDLVLSRAFSVVCYRIARRAGKACEGFPYAIVPSPCLRGSRASQNRVNAAIHICPRGAKEASSVSPGLGYPGLSVLATLACWLLADTDRGRLDTGSFENASARQGGSPRVRRGNTTAGHAARGVERFLHDAYPTAAIL